MDKLAYLKELMAHLESGLITEHEFWGLVFTHAMQGYEATR